MVPRIILSQGHMYTTLDMTPANLSSVQAQWIKRSVFHWYNHLAAIFVPLVGLEDVIAHMEALIKFT